MKQINVQCPSDKYYLLPIGDIHIGDKAFGGEGYDKLMGNLEWASNHADECGIFLMGDIFNCASRISKTSPFESESGQTEFDKAVEIFEPYRELIIGAIRGNHEHRMVDQFGFDPLAALCGRLNIPYQGITATIKVQVGVRKENPNWYENTYYVAAHHSRGGGGTLGNSLNRATLLERLVTGCDVYMIGHNHQLSHGCRKVFQPTPTGIKERKVHYVSCGAYLTYENSYAEEAMMAPGKLGSPRIRFSGERDHHDTHISI